MNDKAREIRVLFVDDEIDFLESTAKALRRRGFHVATVADGIEAIQTAKVYPFDVAILDVKMPGMDGHRLFYALHGEQPHMQMLMLTGHGDMQKAFELGKNGLHSYLAKPIAIDELVQAIQAAHEQKAKQTSPQDNLTDGLDELFAVRVLLVDDEPDFLESTAKVLSRRAMTVQTSERGEQALIRLSENSIDVAVLDVKMPGMDGLTLMQRIKAGYPTVEVILLTGHGNVSLAVEGMKAGAFDYLLKPQEPEELARIIRAACRKKRNSERVQQDAELKALIDKNPS